MNHLSKTEALLGKNSRRESQCIEYMQEESNHACTRAI
jgi:hypothetical protein